MIENKGIGKDAAMIDVGGRNSLLLMTFLAEDSWMRQFLILPRGPSQEAKNGLRKRLTVVFSGDLFSL